MLIVDLRIRAFIPHVEDFAPTSMAAVEQLSDFDPENKANQPLQYGFAKLEFGRTKILKRRFQAHCHAAG